MTEDELDPEAPRAAGKDEIRVLFSLADSDVLEYLVDDTTEEPTDLPSRLYLAWEQLHGRSPRGEDEVSCEDEEEDPVMAFYYRGLSLDHLLQLVRVAIPKEFTASGVPVPEAVCSGAQIAITRR